MDNDIWAAGQDGGDGAGGSSGPVDFSQGMPNTQALGPEVVLKAGFGFLRWRLVEMVIWCVAFVMLVLAASCVTAPIGAATEVMSQAGTIDPVVAQVVSTVANQIAGLFITTPVTQFLMVGLMVYAVADFRGEGPELGVMFTQFGRTWKAVLTTWVVTLLAYAAMSPALVLGGVTYAMMDDPMVGVGVGSGVLLLTLPVLVYVFLGLALATYAAALENVGPLDAIRLSWTACSGARFQIFLTGLAVFVVTLGLMLLCCVPVLLATPLQVVGFTAAWMLVSRPRSETEQWDRLNGWLEG